MIFTYLLLQPLQKAPATLINLQSDTFIIVKPKRELTEIEIVYSLAPYIIKKTNELATTFLYCSAPDVT